VSNKLLNKIPKALSLKGKKIPDNFNFSKLETSSLKILLRESKDKTKSFDKEFAFRTFKS
jgi:hypothetical protein